MIYEACLLNYGILSTQVKRIVYTKSGPDVSVSYASNFSYDPVNVPVARPSRTKQRSQRSPAAAASSVSLPVDSKEAVIDSDCQSYVFGRIKSQERKPKLCAEKVTDLKSMYKFMNEVDVQFYNTILKN